jgi:hypothetical protein
MTVIAMGRELGSQGKKIADGVAKKLGLPLIHYEVIDHLSDRSRVRRSHVVRLLNPKDDPSSELTADHTLPAILSAYEILELAGLPEGALLRGWGAAALLASVPHVIRVRVTASIEARMKTLQKKFPKAPPDLLKKEIGLFDEAHAAVMKRHFGVDYRDDAMYHMTVDASQTSVSECVGRIVALAGEARFVPTPASNRKLESLMTEAHVKALLKLHPPTRDLAIDVAADGRIVRLGGRVSSDELKARCELVAWRVPGIEGVQNSLAVAA